MSLYGAMMLGIDGLDANANALSIYSSNIANVNTIGYKDVSAEFSTMLTQMFGGIDDAGVTATAEQNNTQQGLLQQAGSPTDLAVSGQGFFAVSGNQDGSGTPMYTRAGNFTENAQGYLQNGAGFYLMGWPVGTGGSVNTGTALSTMNLSGLTSPPLASTLATLVGNLDSNSTIDSTYTYGDMAGGNATPDFTTTVNVTDSQGGTQPLTVNFVETGANQWAYEVDYGGNLSNIGNPPPTSGLLTGGTMTFNSDGSLESMTQQGQTGNVTNLQVTIPFVNGLNPQTITMNLGTPGGTGTSGGGTDGFTQYASDSLLANSTVDGEAAGTLTGVTIGTNGMVTASFSNGLTQNVFQIPLATFANADGLTSVSGDAFTASLNSGTANINEANSGAAGAIESGALEGSTVDLATEFTNLITSQRAYSAGARIVTTADEMLQTLDQLPSS